MRRHPFLDPRSIDGTSPLARPFDLPGSPDGGRGNSIDESVRRSIQPVFLDTRCVVRHSCCVMTFLPEVGPKTWRGVSAWRRGHGRFAGPGLLVHARPFAAPPCRHQGESGGSAGPVEAACFQHGDVVAVLVVLTVSVRSALWPGSRCLSSMLTGPCPVSALLHAGVVNGGASFSSA